jgi:glutathione S-transferase
MARQLFELTGADGRLFSPYCWRIRMALANKGLEAESVPIRFSDKALLAFSGQDRVPVLKDGDTTVFDSWAIACYLERAYPDAPPMFGNGQATGMCRFINQWADRVQLPGISQLVIHDIFLHIDPADRDYFRSSREKRLGRTLEEVQAERDERVIGFRGSLAPLRATLKDQPFISGDFPGYADHIVFGGFQWARAISEFKLLESDDAVYAWREKMLGLFNGLAGNAPGYPC